MGRPDPMGPSASDRSPWNWLLFVPIVLPLMVVLFNAKEPDLLGFPRFYWLQLAFIVSASAPRRSSTR